MNTKHKRSPLLVVENELFAINCFAVLKDLDSFQQLDHYLYNYIVSDALYDPEIHNLKNACQHGYLSTVQYLIEEEGIEYKDRDYTGSLHVAVKNGKLEVVKYFFEKNLADRRLWIIHVEWASYKGHLNVVKYIVEQIEKTLTRVYCERSLFWASKNGHLDVVKYLVERGADANNARGIIPDDYALCHASQNGYLEIVKCLVEHGADVHISDDLALIWASERGNLKIVEFLVEKGANIHARKDLALYRSSCRGHLDVVKYLVDHGANARACNA